MIWHWVLIKNEIILLSTIKKLLLLCLMKKGLIRNVYELFLIFGHFAILLLNLPKYILQIIFSEGMIISVFKMLKVVILIFKVAVKMNYKDY